MEKSINRYHVLMMLFLSILTNTGICQNNTDSLPAYHSKDNLYFAFSVSHYMVLPNSQMTECNFIYKIFRRDTLIDQYCVNEGIITRISNDDSDFLKVVSDSAFSLEEIRNKYFLTEIAYSSKLSEFFQVDFDNIRTTNGRIYGCGQSKGSMTKYTLFTLIVKRNNQVVYSQKFKISRPILDEFKAEVNAIPVYYSLGSKSYIVYKKLTYYGTSYLYWSNELIKIRNK